MKELSLHILDIAENSVTAGADRIEIKVIENLNKDKLIISIADNGKGMDAQTVSIVSDPFITSRTTRKVGLGIPFFKAAAESCDGYFKIESKIGDGTTIEAGFRHSHIDRMPLGDIESTFLNLLIGYPQVNWIFQYQANGKKYFLDDRDIKEVLGDIPLSEPEIINFLRQQMHEGITTIRITE